MSKTKTVYVGICVTQNDINNATKRLKRKDGTFKSGAKPEASCPIAIATKRALGLNRVFVDSDFIEADGFELATLPKKASEFVQRFDNEDLKNRPVKPLEFWLRFKPFETIEHIESFSKKAAPKKPVAKKPVKPVKKTTKKR